jgi:flagellar biogenesis protein FliO
MSPNDMAALTVALITILGSFIAAIRWLVKHYLSELKPDNNGQHNLEGRIARIENKLDTLYEILITKN